MRVHAWLHVHAWLQCVSTRGFPRVASMRVHAWLGFNACPRVAWLWLQCVSTRGLPRVASRCVSTRDFHAWLSHAWLRDACPRVAFFSTRGFDACPRVAFRLRRVSTRGFPYKSAPTTSLVESPASDAFELYQALPAFKAIFYPDTNDVRLPETAWINVIAVDKGSVGTSEQNPTAILIALAAAGRNPTDITLPTQGTAPTIPIPTPMATPTPTPTSTSGAPTSTSSTPEAWTTSSSSLASTSAATSNASAARTSSRASTSAATSDASADSLSSSSSASAGTTSASGISVAATETVEADVGDGGSSGSHLAPEQAGGSGGGGFWSRLGSFFSGSTESPQPAPPEQHVSPEELWATLDRMQTAAQQVRPGAMPGRSGETMGQRMGNLYQTLAVDFPIYAGGIILDQAVGILIGNAGEFLAFQLAAKAKGFLVTAAKKGGKLVLNVVNAEGKNVEAAAFSKFVDDWNEAYRARGRVSASSKYPKDYATNQTRNWSGAFKSEGEARQLAREKLGRNPIEVEPGKWRSQDGKWQYRAKPGDVTDRHIHLEELNPATGEVLQNLHLRWPENMER